MVILLNFNGYDPEVALFDNEKYDSSGYSDSIQLKVLNETREFFKDYDVTVTTDEYLYNSYPVKKRYRAVISTTKVLRENGFWVTEMTGIAYYNIHYLGDTSAAYINAEGYHKSDKYVAANIAHEVGHLIGLAHQSVFEGVQTIAEYRPATKDSIAPIMGNPTAGNRFVWYDGTNDFGQYQSDTAILAKVLGRTRH